MSGAFSAVDDQSQDGEKSASLTRYSAFAYDDHDEIIKTVHFEPDGRH